MLEYVFVVLSFAILGAAAVGALTWISFWRPRLGFYAICALAPTQFIFIPISDFFISPADILVLAGGAGLAWRLASDDAAARRSLRLHVFLGLMVAGYLFGFLALDHFSRTLVRVPMAILPSILACELLRERRHLARAVAALVLAGVIDTGYGAYFFAIGQPLHPGRFSGMMGVNFSAMAILAAASMAFARFARTRAPMNFLMPGVLALFGLATLSKMGVVALVAAWVLIIARIATSTNRRLAVTAAVLLVGLALTQDMVRERLLARARPELQLDGVQRTSTDVRLLILRSAWRGLAEQPLFGVGYFKFEEYSLRDPEIRASTAGIGYGTHNTYLEILVEGGLLAFIPFLLHFLSYARNFRYTWCAIARQQDVIVAAAMTGLIVVLICAAVANVLLHYLFWCVCGVALACIEQRRAEAQS
jgi:O-antigen ligase